MREIAWAPLNVPLRRRLETLCAFGWISLFLFGELGMLFFYLYLLIFGGVIAKTLCIIYGIFIYIDRDAGVNGGRGQGVKWFRNLFCWKLFQSYFPAKLHKTVDLPADRNYIFATFPHGVLSTGCFLSFATDTNDFYIHYPGIRSRVVTLDFHLIAPFFRELCLSWGVASCSQQSIVNLLVAPNDSKHPYNSDGYTSNAVVIIVGGAAESLNCRPNNYHLVLKKRKGFCRIALQTGTAIVPVINFGELDLFDQPPNPPGSRLRRFQEWVKATTGIAPAALVGRGFFQYSFGVIPRRKPINTVIGAPVEVEKIDNPSKEQIEALHVRFCAALEDLFETHKTKYVENYENVKLVLE
ncbi:2-acylglycerol O-acyltransferase 2-A-like isoform X1 [Toxorhynchites rutilus septentrionalis]|uniref:2-acylglycerol O-acyltransferase 2-A-like isoform X1 n=1 Tax=Toxorhynchites rutilus septentrionalis TaxID=329112 RepID=UPI002479CD93|nr:2-acylglycerol O-acyltransferase 2-A-like isoform X1 [Toxorhynchites rutilus septentrionalis]XP_055620644.1 2-acylglycerol O-acyltransferase 2-A-like isoform X1 [Toxorhynchites rutilus septentrionalis]XP_055620646.1 2-acylglycerol O-acyltransferase 2-A-like isoform X1 [Toxorhynchites rutilus septentrionalis]XP_055620648.1 2-acylglycerol O-acyltransferase 2-A-like isoform X1 [Toxorhynchites rutilus septentrionalis]XP_055620649.1 2-acylglycerol O-acyltransferase 2-A-like isoform X1 [Toxorhynch